MLDFTFFSNPRFSAASASITLTFFAMFGSIFIFTQFLQFVLGYSPLQTGVRLLAFAVPMMIVAPLSSRFVDNLGTKRVVATGMILTTIGLLLLSFIGADSSYVNLAWRMVIMASGLALTMAPATESIMGSLPLAKAGVGSAVNDTTRQVGGALGVAVLGSVYTSLYGSHVVDALAGQNLPADTVAQVKDSIGGAAQAAATVGGSTGAAIVDAARSAFMDGFHTAVRVGALFTFMGIGIVVRWLPARARDDDRAVQADEFAVEHPELQPDAVTQ